MQLTSIKSQRAFHKEKYWQIVYQWEDILSKELEIPIISQSQNIHLLTQAVSYNNSKSLVFDMTPYERMAHWIFRANKSTLPYIIDYFCSDTQIDNFIKAYKNAPLILISSREVYEYLKKIETTLNIQHLALSIPDEDAKISNIHFNDKKYDLVVAGRTSELWNDWITKYSQIHPEFKLVTRKIKDGSFTFEYNGNVICNADSRSEYMNLISESKVFIYSTPGLDGDKGTNGFHPVTPRFMEGLCGGCNMILRYPNNPDTEYFELSRFNESVESFEQFFQQMDKALCTRPDLDFYSNYLHKHKTSNRAKELKEILEKY